MNSLYDRLLQWFIYCIKYCGSIYVRFVLFGLVLDKKNYGNNNNNKGLKKIPSVLENSHKHKLHVKGKKKV